MIKRKINYRNLKLKNNGLKKKAKEKSLKLVDFASTMLDIERPAGGRDQLGGGLRVVPGEVLRRHPHHPHRSQDHAGNLPSESRSCR